MEEKIDFLITWVDGNDPVWRKDFEHYSEFERKEVDKGAVRFRDWETLHYWFRGVEKFAPWVNKIFFVTYGHVPGWLNTDHPKLQIVRHEDFIPSEYLPTFNSKVIEFYFHKIKGLSEKFVYFNDDMFLINHVRPDRFFRDGLPCDFPALSDSVHPSPTMFDSSIFLARALINKFFNKQEAIRSHFSKWYPPNHVRLALNNFQYRKRSVFPGFMMNHLPQGYLKRTYEEVWASCREDLERTSSRRFRSWGDVAPWLIRYWQLASGNFIPYSYYRDGIYYGVDERCIDDIVRCIKSQRKSMMCLNDNNDKIDFDVMKRKVQEAFEYILPEKSLFEK